MKNKTFLSIFLFLLLSFATAFAENITLSGNENYEAQNGDVLTGLTSGTVTIANGAKITLSDVTISGGIVCSGTAEITLVGTNSVSGATNMAGIQVGGSGTTLTIKGNGSLTANGGGNSAGIGLSRAWKVDATGGDIVIEGGNITATGKGMGAGIGTGVSFGDEANHTATIGNITIKGGTVTAIGGTNQYFPGSGIGKGGAYSYGNTVVGTVTITTNIDLVNASSISESVTYMHNETDVTDNKADYFTINEDGDRRIIVPKDDIDYNVTIDEEITGGTVTADKTTAKAGELVTLTIIPASGHALQSLAVKDASDYDVPVSNKKFIMPKGSVTVSATFIQTTAAFDEATGVLTLNGNVVADEVKAYGAIIGDYGAIVKESPVTSVVCEPGTVLPADCSELFLNYTNLITIDLSNADISGVTNMSKMFGSQSLTTIYVNSTWSMENVTSSDQMFYGCNLLRGGNGSRWEDVRVAVWESNGNDLEAAKAKASRSSYAIIDGKGGLPGYLTVKPKQTPSAPTANVITYTGEAQELVSAGDGTMLYSLDDGIYSAEIPTATAAGTYTVHYKVDGSDNWNAVIAQTVEVTIAPKALSITAKNKTIAYGDEPANDGVEYSGFVGSDDASVLGGTLTYGYNYEIWDDTGEYTITPNGLTADNYNITFVNGTLTVEPKRRKFAAVTIEEDQDGRTAVLDCSYDRDDEINLPEYEDGIEVNAIKVKRTFGINTPATIVLPFKLPTETRTNADFYDLYSVEQVGNTWKARMEKIPDGHIQPLHPYAIIVYEEELTFDLQGKHVTVYMDENEIDTVKSQDKLWYFVGVYQYKTWGGDQDKELGLAYAFAGRNEHNIAKGQFGKIAAGGYAYPLRAYLRKKDASVQLKPVQNRPLASGEQRAASVANLFNEDNTPETIEVEFFEKDQNGEEHTTFIGRMDTRTGEFSSIRPSRIFDLKGRHVGKPKAKGAYFKK
ncbi:MAG: MBG domain-containing protein [Fibrobacter sp.]|uniref:MBG domain-containing protein n=1 Tax=Fibrobacter sp. TaxID=35828 RepID=UPI002A9208A7|nr:MBG domain-containing protein [Fibrobacter sp.]MDY6264911.1 MBG domain-containing protein [Fibrobacter sp.]